MIMPLVLLFDEGALHGMQLTIFAQPLQSGYFSLTNLRNRQLARLGSIGTHQHHAGATLFQTTTVLWAIQPELIA